MKKNEKLKSEINIEKSIKSLYILKEIFSFLSEKQELNLISVIYKEGGRNGKVKEYDRLSNTMIFEGEYLNGKRNGKGKEYYNKGNLKYEGKYLNGKRNVKGKEFLDYGKLIFEGKYLNGKRIGKGKE